MVRKSGILLISIFLMGLLWLQGCSSPSSDLKSGDNESVSSESCNQLVYESSMELEYAENFSVDYYQGGYKLLSTKDGTRILTVPEGKEGRRNARFDRIHQHGIAKRGRLQMI